MQIILMSNRHHCPRWTFRTPPLTSRRDKNASRTAQVARPGIPNRMSYPKMTAPAPRHPNCPYHTFFSQSLGQGEESHLVAKIQRGLKGQHPTLEGKSCELSTKVLWLLSPECDQGYQRRIQ